MIIKMKKLYLAVIIGLCTTACGSKSADGTQPVVVKTAVVEQTDAAARQSFAFISQPRRTSQLSFRVGGPIDRFDVYVGNSYKRGGIIAEIDPRDFKIRKERAESVYKQAQAEYERLKSLYEKNNISASTYDKAKAEWISAKTAFETASNELADTKLIAPFSGYIGELFIEKFQDVKPTQPIVTLIDIGELKIEAYVTQEIALRSQGLERVNLCFDAMPDKIYTARVVEVSKSTTANNLSYLLTALLPNADGALLAGMSGKVFFDTTRATPALTVPQQALCHRPTEGDYVWVVSDGVASQRKITVGKLLHQGVATIAEGLQAGDVVAVSGLRFLSDGMSVTTEPASKLNDSEGDEK